MVASYPANIAPPTFPTSIAGKNLQYQLLRVKNAINFCFNKPGWVDKATHFDKGTSRSNAGETFTMGLRRIPPPGNIRQHDSSPDNVRFVPTSFFDRSDRKFQAVFSLTVNVAEACGFPVFYGSCSRNRYEVSDPAGSGKPD